MKKLSTRLDQAIQNTPTGELRNLLCDLNIALRATQKEHKARFIEFGKFAKNPKTPKDVEKAFDAWIDSSFNTPGYTPIDDPKKEPFTASEGNIMDLLVRANHQFRDLNPSKNTSLEWAKGIHQCQTAVMLRVLVRDYPTTFSDK